MSFSKTLVGFLFSIYFMSLLVGCATNVKLKDFDLEELVHDIEKKAYVVKAFRAQFVKTRHSAIFDRDLTVKGVLVFQKPNIFRLLTTGDINVEIISDGSKIILIHDGRDHEMYELQGERDLSRFADPLVLLINRMGHGALRKFSVTASGTEDDAKRIEIDPREATNFERVDRAFVWYGNSGNVEKVKLLFKDGGWDETRFLSWALLPSDSPEISRLRDRLRDLSSTNGDEESGTPRNFGYYETRVHDPVWKRPFLEYWSDPSARAGNLAGAETCFRSFYRSLITSP